MVSPRSRLPVIVAVLATVLVLAAIGIAALTVGPAVWAAATTERVPADTTVTLETEGASASIPVAAGWSYNHPPFDRSRLTLRSPDGAMSIDFALVPGAGDADAEAAARDLVSEEVGLFDREPIGASSVVHARSADGTVLVGAVVGPDSLVAFSSRPTPAYDAELATVLAGVVVGAAVTP